MGSATSKDRYERAATTGILTLDKGSVASWSSLAKGLKGLPSLRTMTITHNTLRDPVPAAFTTLSLWGTLVSLDLSHNRLGCACALGSDVPLSKRHVEEALTRITGAPRTNASGDTTRLPLESLNISANDLHMLPPFLAVRFPRLRRLVCTDNKRALEVPLSLARCIGTSSSLEVVSLERNQLKAFIIADDTSDQPFPALRELLLDQNHLNGTVDLGFVAGKEAPVMPSLRRISLNAQTGKEPLRCISPAIFIHCPGLNSLSFQGNSREEELHDLLVQSDSYCSWQEQQRAVVNKKLHAGGQAELI
ncbi:hypothetical protein JKF63_04942 [Porcisia hertigi]|uniref:Uncharacterized protein n=1 Tax=Porcisia hertigi TaxID=2761500 RepID=A0A836IV08_9TRYP|nr:hypothetical protein JKF63_04942 [Porcisia hertigi]